MSSPVSRARPPRGWLLLHRADANRVRALWELEGLTITLPEDAT